MTQPTLSEGTAVDNKISFQESEKVERARWLSGIAYDPGSDRAHAFAEVLGLLGDLERFKFRQSLIEGTWKYDPRWVPEIGDVITVAIEDDGAFVGDSAVSPDGWRYLHSDSGHDPLGFYLYRYVGNHEWDPALGEIVAVHYSDDDEWVGSQSHQNLDAPAGWRWLNAGCYTTGGFYLYEYVGGES